MNDCRTGLQAVAIGAIAGFISGIHPVRAQDMLLQAPADRVQVDEGVILVACASGTVTSDLPNPFIDLLPTDWAYEAVLTMYYCGPYRGAVPPEQLLEFRESRQSQSA